MKNARSITINDAFDNRLELSNHQENVPKSKLAYGSVEGLYPVILEGGRTTIFISDARMEAATRKKYKKLQQLAW